MKIRDFPSVWRILPVLGGLLLGGCVEGVSTPEEPVVYTGPSAPLVLGRDNAGPVLARAWDWLDGMSLDAAAWLADVPVALAGSTGPTASVLPGPLAQLRRALARLPGLPAAEGQAAGVLHRGWQACAAGGGYFWEAEQAFPGEVNAGDRYVLEFAGCREGGGMLDGRLILDIDFADGLLGGEDYRLEGRADFMALRHEDLVTGLFSLMDGVMFFTEWAAAGAWHGRVSGERLLLRMGPEQYRFRDFRFLAEDDPLGGMRSADFVLDSTELGGRIRVTTLDPFLFDPLDGGRPWQGRFEVTGAGGAWLELEAEPDARHLTLLWNIEPPVDDLADGVDTLPWADLSWWRPF